MGTQFFGDSITCGYGGDNNFQGDGNFTTGGFAFLVQAALGGPYGNDCAGGDMILDTATKGRIYGLRDPGESGNPVYVLGDATNDVAFDQRIASRLAISHAAYLGALYWLAIPPRGKVMAATCASQGFLTDDSVERNMGARSTRPGETLECSLETTHGEPIIFAYQVSAGDLGRFNLSIDNVSQGTYGGELADLQPLTFHHATSVIIAGRIPVQTGRHTVKFTNQSPAGTGTVSIQWLAVPPRLNSIASLPPVITLSAIHSLLTEQLVADTPTGKLTGKEFDPLSGDYDDFIQSVTMQASQDGLNVHYADTRNALGTDQANYHDPIHPNQAGYERMAKAILKLFGK